VRGPCVAARKLQARDCVPSGRSRQRIDWVGDRLFDGEKAVLQLLGLERVNHGAVNRVSSIRGSGVLNRVSRDAWTVLCLPVNKERRLFSKALVNEGAALARAKAGLAIPSRREAPTALSPSTRSEQPHQAVRRFVAHHDGARKRASTYGAGLRIRCLPSWTCRTRCAWPSEGSRVRSGYARPLCRSLSRK
jgi:hypothetical protein